MISKRDSIISFSIKFNRGKRVLLLAIGFFLIVPSVFSQNKNLIGSLRIGDTIPADLELTNVYNYPISKIRLSDLKGKLVILDFWSTWCGACIEMFPEVHALQKQFGDQLQIILVNSYEGDNESRVKTFFDNRQKRTGMTVDLPYSLLQTTITEYFPYKFIPHYVWINKKGEVIATTSQAEITSSNIALAIKGILPRVHIKQDQLDFDSNAPLFVNGNGGYGSKFTYRTLLTDYIEGIGNGTGMQRDEKDNITRFYMYNTLPIMLLRIAYPKELNRPVNQIQIEVSDRQKFDPRLFSDSLLYSIAVCYELITPPINLEKFRSYLREDIKRLFNVVVYEETVKAKCYILKSKNAASRIVSKGGSYSLDVARETTKKHMKNAPVSDLIYILNTLSLFSASPVIDATNFVENIDLNFPANLHHMSLEALQSFLKQNGLFLSEEERGIEVGVISSTKSNN